MRRFFAALALAALCACTPPVVMAHPEIRFVVWGGQDSSQLESDWSTLLANGVLDRLVEYGVHGGTLGPTLHALPDLQPAVFDDLWIMDQLDRQVSPDSGTAYVVVLPVGSNTLWMKAWESSGYHSYGGAPYAVVTLNEPLISHEIYEMATDPFGLGVHIGLQEVGDLCEGQVEAFGGVTVQQVWSITNNACE